MEPLPACVPLVPAEAATMALRKLARVAPRRSRRQIHTTAIDRGRSPLDPARRRLSGNSHMAAVRTLRIRLPRAEAFCHG